MQAIVQLLPKRLQNLALDDPLPPTTRAAAHHSDGAANAHLPASSPASVAALYDKIIGESPSSYARKNKAIIEQLSGVARRLDALQAAGISLALSTAAHTANGGGGPASRRGSDPDVPGAPLPALVTPLDLWMPLRQLMDESVPPRMRELSLDSTQKLLAMGLLHGVGPASPDDDAGFTLVGAAVAASIPAPPSKSRTATPAPLSSGDPTTTATTAAAGDATVRGSTSPLNSPALVPGSLSDEGSRADSEGQLTLETVPPPIDTSDVRVEDAGTVSSAPAAAPLAAPSPVHILSPLNVDGTNPTGLGSSTTGSPGTNNGSALTALSQPISLMEDIITVVSTCFPSLSAPVSAEEPVHIQVLKVLLTATTLGAAQVHNMALLKALQTCFNFYLYSRNKNIVTTARAALTQIMSAVVAHLSAEPVPPARARDVFLAFRALCKLATKSFNEKEAVGPQADASYTVRCRALALELLLSASTQVAQWRPSAVPDILQGSLSADLSMAISKNATSPHTLLFDLSLQLFSLLVTHYRAVFKSQIAVLLCDVYFPVLAGNASVPHKQMLMQTLTQLAGQPQVVVDLYVNFDCGIEQPSCLEEFIAAICNPPAAIAPAGVAAAEALAKSLATWMRRPVGAAPAATHSTVTAGAGGALADGMTAAGRGELVYSPSLHPDAALGGGILAGATALGVTPPLTSDPNSQTGSPLVGPSAESARVAEEAILQRKLHTKYGLELFCKSPLKGVEYLLAYEVVPKDDVQALAQFLHASAPSKTKLGEYLGELSAIAVMHAYVDVMDFHDLDFVDALRTFLSGFRLPGEAQKIDRIMEKFADKYCGDNPSIFTHADTAYVLAFSVIMLNTDQHSKQVKKRMTKDDFIKNNRRIDNTGALTDDYFGNIFDEIKDNEIQLEDAPNVDEVAETEEQRNEMYKREAQAIQKRSQHKMRGAKDMSVWKTAELPDYSRLIYQGAHTTVVQTLVASRSALGLQTCLEIACHFGLKDERQEAVQSFVELAGLMSTSSAAATNEIDMSQVSALISTAHTMGSTLNESWEPILACLSQLDKRGVSLDNEAMLRVDRIFTGTAQWPAPALIHFITALCNVSSQEVADKRSYSLQRLVEVASYNINRIRFEFNQIFRLVLGYFENVVKIDEEIARFAVDSLRQLTSKFLEREELAHFSSQVEFMRPFETMMRQATTPELQEMILVSLLQIVRARFCNLKSGWKAVFPVILIGRHHATAKDLLVFVQPHFPEIQASGAAVDYIVCLSEVCSCATDGAEQLLDILAGIQSDRTQVLRGLTAVALQQPTLTLRSRAVELLFGSVQTMTFVPRVVCDTVLLPLFLDNHKLDVVWVQAMQRLVRLWMAQPLNAALLANLCQVMTLAVAQNNENIAQCAVVCFQEMLKHAAALPSTTGAASPSTSAPPSNLANSNGAAGAATNDGSKLVSVWPTLIATMSKLAQATLPRGLENVAPAPGDSDAPKAPEFGMVMQHCIAHLSLLNNLQPFLTSSQPGIPLEFLVGALPLLRTSRDFARSFNGNMDLRGRIWRAGLTANPPNLTRQEALATSLVMTCLGSILSGFAGQEKPYLGLLQDVGDDLIDEFLSLPATLTTGSALAIKAKPFVAPSLVLFYGRLGDLLFGSPACSTPATPIARHFFTRALTLLREEEPSTRLAAVTYLEQVNLHILTPMWTAAAPTVAPTTDPSVTPVSPIP
ncbi:hypothetical protein BC828DRAFT_372407 [Blastocladiella britannica]|nr:hypothetical protein BC828DRAFT_372407 [Blastocladiella britannica]